MSSIGLLTTLCFSLGLLWLHGRIRTASYESQYEKTQQLVQSSWSVVNHYGKQVDAGIITRQQAQETAMKVIRSLRYGNNNYFWINDLQPQMIMHPTNPALDGKDLSGYKDPNGLPIFMEMARICRDKGEGRVAYMWAKPGSTVPVPKISYVKLYEPWGWIVGAGVYVDDVEAGMHTLTLVFLGIAGLACTLSLAFTYGLARSISARIRTIVNGLMEGAHQVTRTARQVSSAAHTLARDASAQAASLEQTAAASEEITTLTRKNAENSQASAGHMTQTSQLVADANRKLAELKISMNEINTSSARISQIIKVIDEIAFQTNILALNASIEAARAGEAGLAFSVVAGEVHNLALHSAKAARDTAALIEETKGKSIEGSAKLDQVIEAIGNITGSAGKVKLLLDEVQVGSQDQASRVKHIANALVEIEQSTHRVAASSEQSATASEQLSAQAESMRGTVGQLEALIDGTAR